MDTNRLVDVKKVIEDYMLQASIDRSQYHRLSAIALQGVRDLNLFKINGSKIVELPMNPKTNTVNLPSDYIRLVSIGIPYHGKMWMFTRNDSILKTTSFVGGAEILDPEDGEGENINDYSKTVGYGTTGGYNQYYYSLDETGGRIIINGFPTTNVILIYMTSGISLDGGIFIPQYAYNWMFNWLVWKDSLLDKSISIGEKQLREENFYIENRKLQKIQMPTLHEIRDALYSTFKQTVKR